jgi:RHS repeat-associated protein
VIVNPKYATQQRERAPETAKAPFCDEVSGLRYFNPTEGRFLSRDPIEEQGGPNLYGFLGNDPISKVDAVGLSFIRKPGVINVRDYEIGGHAAHTEPHWRVQAGCKGCIKSGFTIIQTSNDLYVEVKIAVEFKGSKVDLGPRLTSEEHEDVHVAHYEAWYNTYANKNYSGITTFTTLNDCQDAIKKWYKSLQDDLQAEVNQDNKHLGSEWTGLLGFD